MEDLTGRRFGRWEVLNYEGFWNNNYRYKVRCKCGTEKVVAINSLKSGKSVSCGCYAKELASSKSKHGCCKNNQMSRLYQIWHSMIQRCCNPNDKAYKHYGGRGITVCEEWKDSKNFVDWANSHGYADNLTIDRIDTNGNYEPSNCRWADWKTQANNTRRNHYVTIEGVTHTVKEWAGIYNQNVANIYWRVKQGMSFEEAITKPVRKGNYGKRVCTQ